MRDDTCKRCRGCNKRDDGTIDGILIRPEDLQKWYHRECAEDHRTENQWILFEWNLRMRPILYQVITRRVKARTWEDIFLSRDCASYAGYADYTDDESD